MIFNSFDFLLFMVMLLTIYYALPHKFRWILLLVGSYIFYMAWNPLLIILLLFSVFVNYFVSLKIENATIIKARKAWLILSLIVNFGILFVFKYLYFFTQTTALLFELLGRTTAPPRFSIILPMGISFYTFQAAGYTLDIYRKEQAAERNFFKFSLFIMFFPQLVAGPIERASNLMPQLFSKKNFSMDNLMNNLMDGLKFMCVGFFKKVVIADRVAVCVNTVYNAPSQHEGLAIILATLLFAFQIYCDFSGYSDIAVGCAKTLGIDLMQNFKQPYFATSIQNFWRRWHISLSTWFKDYVYFPLGGNRVTKPRYYFNTMVTFLVSGLWHGANWTFVIWGALHGAYQVVGNLLPKSKIGDKLLITRLFKTLFTFGLVCFTWIFFRANTMADALYLVRHLLTGHAQWLDPQYVFDVLNNMGVPLIELLIGVACILLLLIIDLFSGEDTIHKQLLKTPPLFQFCFYFFISTIILALGVYNDAGAFIYFQF